MSTMYYKLMHPRRFHLGLLWVRSVSGNLLGLTVTVLFRQHVFVIDWDAPSRWRYPEDEVRLHSWTIV